MAAEVFDPHAPIVGVYTCQQVAERLQVSYQTVRREVRRGRLGSVRVGNQIRITERHLSRYLDDQPTSAAEAS